MSKETFVVIGSNSFSGAQFSAYVMNDNPEAQVIGISRSPEPPECFRPYHKCEGGQFTFHQLDLNHDLDAIMEIIHQSKAEYVVNFAAQSMVGQSWENPEQWFQTNCISVMKLGMALSNVKTLKRYVHISSPEIYGDSSGESEAEVQYAPSTPYAASKAAGDLALLPYYLHKGLPLVYTRATNVYGPYQQLYRIVPRTVLFARMGKKLQLHGGGTAVKSYIHIRDVCEATMRIARNGQNGKVYHIAPDGSGISIYDLVKLTLKRMGLPMEGHVEVVGERLGQDKSYVLNSSKVRMTLAWRPTISLPEGIDEIIAWVDEYYDQLIKQPMDYIHKP